MCFNVISRLVLGAAFLSAASTARADSFRYSYSFYDPGAIAYYQFVYDSPSLITTDEAFLTPSSCTAYGTSCDQVGVFAVTGDVKIYGANALDDPGLLASFFTVGDHISGFSSMTITENATASPVPEPSTLIFVGTGVLGAATRLIRRRW